MRVRPKVIVDGGLPATYDLDLLVTLGVFDTSSPVCDIDISGLLPVPRVRGKLVRVFAEIGEATRYQLAELFDHARLFRANPPYYFRSVSEV